MTTLKRLSIALTLALGIQFSAGAYFSAEHKRNTESALILDFTQGLLNQNSTQTQTIALWVNNKACHEKEWINGKPYDTTWYPQSIVSIITNNSLTEKTKINLLSNMMAQEKRTNKKRAIQQCVSALCTGALCIGTIALMTWAIIEDIRNRKPRLYIEQPTPRVTITYKTSSYLPHVTWYGPVGYWYL